MRFRFHLIPNAHLDPVWLWDGREGLNEGIQTCRTILDLMDEDPELTFIRGESAIYRHIERHDPETFARIRAMVEAGRWDIVGGTVIQPDTNLPATETFLRQFEVGGAYFLSRFGKLPRIAWAADSFGHSGGMPDIFAACGIEGFAYTRPFEGVAGPFWWEGVGGGRVLAYRPPTGWYGSERDEMPRRLDGLLREAHKLGFVNVGVFFGVGNHGGGPTRRQLAEIRAWAAEHAGDIEQVHSGLHRLFDDLRSELTGRDIPVRVGELNFCLRGCYASAAKFKFLYRKAEAALSRAETIGSAVAAATGEKPEPLADAWETLLFNSFHDVLPGTSIERAYDDQLAQLGGVLHAAQKAELTAINALARRVDTTVPKPEGDAPSAVPFLVVNPHPHPFSGLVELEACLDYRPLWAYRNRVGEIPAILRGPDGQPVPFQPIAVENLFGAETLPWRVRALVPATLAGFGWSVWTLGLEEGTDPAAPDGGAQAVSEAEIASDRCSVQAEPGAESVILRLADRTIPLSLVTVEDPWGSWGAMDEAAEARELSTVRHRWKVERVQVLEKGPLRASLWVRLTGGSSWLDLTLSLSDARDMVDISARVLWNERSARLKLCVPTGASEAAFDVPGGVVTRPAGSGEVPGGRWVSAGDLTLVTDALYNFDLTSDGDLRATICRASRYAAEAPSGPDDAPWQPAVDVGELKFRAVITPSSADASRLAGTFERPVIVQSVAASPGEWGRSFSLGALAPVQETLELLALHPASDGDGWIVRWRNTESAPITPRLRLGDAQSPPLSLPETPPGAIRAARVTLGEKPTVTQISAREG